MEIIYRDYPLSIYKHPEPMEMMISTPKTLGSIYRINVTEKEEMTLELSMEEKIIVTVLWVFTIFFLVLVSGMFEGGHEPIKPSKIQPPPPPSRPHPLLFRRRLRVRTKNEEDMFYEAKQGTKTYEYIKGILDAEKRSVRLIWRE